LKKSNLIVEKQKALPLIYEEVKLDVGYRIDIIVENKFIIEVKSVESLNEVHLAQVLTYLRLSNCKLGLLINFNVKLLKDGVRRNNQWRAVIANFVPSLRSLCLK
jgi:GxxExxY protein